MRDKLVKVEGERTLYIHAYLYEASDFALEQAQQTEEGSFYNCLYSIIMAAFYVEAYLNYVGREHFDEWDEKATPLDKLKAVAREIGIEVNNGRKPFQSIRLVNKFRNCLAHGHIAKLSNSYIRTKSCIRKLSADSELLTWWESVCTINSASRYLRDIEEVVHMIANGYHLEVPPHGLLHLEFRHTKPVR